MSYGRKLATALEKKARRHEAQEQVLTLSRIVWHARDRLGVSLRWLDWPRHTNHLHECALHTNLSTPWGRATWRSRISRVRRKVAARICTTRCFYAMDTIDLCFAYIAKRLIADFPCDRPLGPNEIQAFLINTCARADYRVIQRLAEYSDLIVPTKSQVQMAFDIVMIIYKARLDDPIMSQR